jgi:hypothetical protein
VSRIEYAEGEEENISDIVSGLEQIHKENDEKRDSDELGALAPGEVAKIIRLTKIGKSLPLRFGLKKYVFIDFPGLNDAEDGDQQLFINLIREHISHADLILYVTDIRQSFIKGSEVNVFSEIKGLVKAENISGHYLELAIIVNKYDTKIEQAYRKKVYNKICGKVGIEADHLFRFSSHKMLLHNVIENKLSLQVPKFMQRGFIEILKTCNVVSESFPKLKARLKEERVLSYADLKFCDPESESDDEEEKGVEESEEEEEEEEAEEDEEEEPQEGQAGPGEEEGANGNTGEFEGDDTSPENVDQTNAQKLNVKEYMPLIRFLKQFQANLLQNRIGSLEKKVTREWASLKALLLSNNPELMSDNPSVAFKIQLRNDIRSLFSLHEKLSDLNSEDSFYYTVYPPHQIWEVVKKHAASESNVLEDVLQVMFGFLFTKHKHDRRMDVLTNGIDIMDWKLKAWLFQYHLLDGYVMYVMHNIFIHDIFKFSDVKNSPVGKWFIALVSDRRFYEDAEIRNVTIDTIGDFIDADRFEHLVDEKYTFDDSYHVENSLNSEMTPAHVRVLVLLSVTPLAILDAMDRSNELPYQTLEILGTDFIHCLRYAIVKRDHEDMQDFSSQIRYWQKISFV